MTAAAVGTVLALVFILVAGRTLRINRLEFLARVALVAVNFFMNSPELESCPIMIEFGRLPSLGRMAAVALLDFFPSGFELTFVGISMTRRALGIYRLIFAPAVTNLAFDIFVLSFQLEPGCLVIEY